MDFFLQLFDQIPPPNEFLKEFKSPCWHRKSDKRLQCLPYFYLAGMPKCGTTDVWAKINSHKGVFGTRKEPHWWARRMIRKAGKFCFIIGSSKWHRILYYIGVTFLLVVD